MTAYLNTKLCALQLATGQCQVNEYDIAVIVRKPRRSSFWVNNNASCRRGSRRKIGGNTTPLCAPLFTRILGSMRLCGRDRNSQRKGGAFTQLGRLKPNLAVHIFHKKFGYV
jgi:hypothetical protein